jgi:hypothetical protein
VPGVLQTLHQHGVRAALADENVAGHCSEFVFLQI